MSLTFDNGTHVQQTRFESLHGVKNLSSNCHDPLWDFTVKLWRKFVEEPFNANGNAKWIMSVIKTVGLSK